MKPTEKEIAKQAKDYIFKNHPDCIGNSPLQLLMYEKLYHAYLNSSNWAISQMQPELATLNRHDKGLRSLITTMTAELKVLRYALKDVNGFSNDDELSEWMLDHDYVLPQPPTK